MILGKVAFDSVDSRTCWNGMILIVGHFVVQDFIYTGWRTKCHTINCARNTFFLLQKHLTPGTELIITG